MFGVKIADRFVCNELRERLEIDDVLTMLQRHRLRWYGHVSSNDENDSVKKCISYEMEGVRPRGIKKLGARLWKRC